jgi:hypothetical protein
MNSKSHFIISLIKSLIRIVGCIWLSFLIPILIPFTAAFGIAELFGIAEEVFDRR